MTDESVDHCFTQSFINIRNGSANMSNDLHLPNSVVQTVIDNSVIPEILPQSTAQVGSTYTLYNGIPTILENLPEGTVFQLMPDSTVLTSIHATEAGNTLSYADLCLGNKNETVSTANNSNVISIPNYTIGVTDVPAVNSTLSNSIKLSGSLSDFDLSFLTESSDPVAVNEEIQNLSPDSPKQFQETIPDCLTDSATTESFVPDVNDVTAEQSNCGITEDSASENCDTVLVDVTKPIQLSQNSLIVVNGQKCILQQDPHTGQVIAYPVKEPIKPKKKRGRPRKVMSDVYEVTNYVEPAPTVGNNIEESSATTTYIIENPAEENPKDEGLLQIVTDDGSLVRRSLRKRKRTKVLIDYETGNLNPELGSDAEDNRVVNNDDDEHRGRKKGRFKGPGRPRKYSGDMSIRDGKRNRGRPKKGSADGEPTQAFLIQMADGQSLMMQVPMSSIPSGMSLQDVAQGIADNFNMQNASAANLQAETSNEPNIDDPTNVSQYLNPASASVSVPLELNCEQSPVAPQSTVEISEASNTTSLLTTEGDAFTTAMSTMSTDSNAFTSALSTMTTTTASQILKMAETLSKDALSCILHTESTQQKDPDDVPTTTDIFSTSTSMSSTSQSINDKLYYNLLTDGDIEGTLSILRDHGLKDMSTLNKKLTEEETVEVVVSSENENKGSSKMDALYKNSGIMDSFDFSFAVPSDLKDSSNVNFLQHCSQLMNGNGPVGDDAIISLNGNEIGNILSQNQIAYQKVITDHEYQAKFSLNGSANGATKDVDDGSQVLSLKDQLVDAQNVNQNVICTTVQSDVEVSETADNVHPLCTELITSTDKSPMPLTSIDGNKTKLNKSKVRANKRRKKFDNEPTILDVQNCLPTAIDINTLPDVTSLLNSTAQESSELTSGLLACSTASTTVIPLSEKMLPLFLPKDNRDELSEMPKKLICTKCGFITTSYDEYKKHLFLHVKDVKRCKCCKYICLSQEEIVNHYKENHPRCICNICNYMADQPYVLKRHMLRHGENGCTCEKCGKVYKDHYILKMHDKMVHMPSEVFYSCEICHKKFNRKAHMKRHLRTHGPDKPYKCPHCEYRGCEKSDITKHMLIHEDPKHKCDVCGKTFRHVKNKELHMKRHKNQRDFKCGSCDFYSYTFTDIRKHIERRHRLGRNICTTCGKNFKTPEALKAHREIEMRQNSMKVYSLDTPIDSEVELKDGEPAEFDIIATEVVDDLDGEGVNIESLEEKAITLDSLTTSQIININEMLSTSSQIIIGGFDRAESLSGANLTIISADGENKEVVLNPVPGNGNLLKLLDNIVFSNNANTSIPYQIST